MKKFNPEIKKKENNYCPMKNIKVIIMNSIKYYAWKDVLLSEYS